VKRTKESENPPKQRKPRGARGNKRLITRSGHIGIHGKDVGQSATKNTVDTLKIQMGLVGTM
jgi:hypothetical protein